MKKYTVINPDNNYFGGQFEYLAPMMEGANVDGVILQTSSEGSHAFFHTDVTPHPFKMLNDLENVLNIIQEDYKKTPGMEGMMNPRPWVVAANLDGIFIHFRLTERGTVGPNIAVMVSLSRNGSMANSDFKFFSISQAFKRGIQMARNIINND
jgi:hypothetical protein